MLMPASLAFTVTAGLAVTEAVQLEIIKLVGLTITSVASIAAAYIAASNRKRVRELDDKVNRKRKAVRENSDGDGVVIVEERRKGAPRDQ